MSCHSPDQILLLPALCEFSLGPDITTDPPGRELPSGSANHQQGIRLQRTTKMKLSKYMAKFAMLEGLAITFTEQCAPSMGTHHILEQASLTLLVALDHLLSLHFKRTLSIFRELRLEHFFFGNPSASLCLPMVRSASIKPYSESEIRAMSSYQRNTT